ncbi:MAG TPA: SRPBCC domain-containing protein [Chitinophagaceae bacterium]|jgi:uncharacterized protein YndB with AHSA1/START domain|nr:SRPBCC domain-containing protein [Chitinophagaceae bacterium]
METKEKQSVQISRDFTVPASRLFEAWIQPQHLKNWWRPMGNRLVEVQNEVQEGGRVEYFFQTEEGTPAFRIHGQYKEVEEGRRLVYTWNWEVPNGNLHDSAFLLRIQFKEQGSGSRLEVVQENFQDEENIQPHRDGWEQALQDLEQYLEQQ